MIDRELAAALGVSTDANSTAVAVAFLRAAGVARAEERLTPASAGYFQGVAMVLAECLLEKHVVIADRVSWAMNEVTMPEVTEAPGVLYAMAPGTAVSRGSVGDLHRACRALVQRAFPKLLRAVLVSWAQDGLIVNIGGEVDDIGTPRVRRRFPGF